MDYSTDNIVIGFGIHGWQWLIFVVYLDVLLGSHTVFNYVQTHTHTNTHTHIHSVHFFWLYRSQLTLEKVFT